MPDRIIRDELWLSERFLDLPTDAARLAFLRFISVCDDFGNFEGGPRRIYRMLHSCTQIKSEDASVTTMDALMACDLVRRYEFETREFFHIPRFKSHRQYLSRLYPHSPWCDPNIVLGKTTRLIITKGLAKDSLLRSSYVAEGVGVGVGEKPIARAKIPRKQTTSVPDEFEVTAEMFEWAKAQGLADSRIMPETDKCMDHHRSKANRFSDWQSAWRNWIRSAVSYQR